jgi:hypothetical protein
MAEPSSGRKGRATRGTPALDDGQGHARLDDKRDLGGP